MKRILFIIIVAISMTSCEKFLNMPPKNIKIVYTMQDVKEAMSLFLVGITRSNANTGTAMVSNNVVYFSGSRIQGPFSRYVNIGAAMCSDDIQMINFVDESHKEAQRGGKAWLKEYNEIKKWETYLYAPKIWKNAYTCVGYLNMVLHDLDNVPDYNQTDYERISGEARVIRAYYLLRLNQLFAPYHLNDYGIPMNFDAENISGGNRWRQTDLYDKLIGELNEVLAYTTEPKDSWNIFYNKKVIKAILAQTYLFKAESCAKETDDYKLAAQYAAEARDNQSIENSVEQQQELNYVPAGQMLDRPHPFALIRYNLAGDGYNNYSPWGRAQFPQQKPTAELLAMYDQQDIRRSVFFAEKDNETYFIKLQSVGSVDNFSETHALFRYAELMLIEAECLARTGQTAEALKLLNEFKASKIPGYAGYTGSDILDEILKERRKEFVLEEQYRWLDMKRLGVTVTREVTGDETGTTETHTLKADDYRYAFPIPSDEELIYHNIPQNPGWRN